MDPEVTKFHICQGLCVLVQDFYLELTEDGQKITPRDYLESALQPLPGSTKAIAAKNEVLCSRTLYSILC